MPAVCLDNDAIASVLFSGEKVNHVLYQTRHKAFLRMKGGDVSHFLSSREKTWSWVTLGHSSGRGGGGAILPLGDK